MKKIITIIALVLLAVVQSQTNKADSLVNLALEDNVKLSGSVINGRGVLKDILFDPSTGNYATSSNYSEYGVAYNMKLPIDYFFWQAEFEDVKYVNYITFGGTYENQPQPNTKWSISYIDIFGSEIIIDKGIGGWVDYGIYENKLNIPIAAKSIKVEIFDAVSIHLRARGGNNKRLNDTKTTPKASLIQYLPSEDETDYFPDLVVTEPADDEVKVLISELIKLLESSYKEKIKILVIEVEE